MENHCLPRENEFVIIIIRLERTRFDVVSLKMVILFKVLTVITVLIKTK